VLNAECALNRNVEILQTVRVCIKLADLSDNAAWDSYVKGHPMRTVYHLSGWRTVISRAYGHKAYYLMAIQDPVNETEGAASGASVVDAGQMRRMRGMDNGPVCGVLPLIQLRLFPLCNALISIPYFDTGGILANDAETEGKLINAAIDLGKKCRAGYIELRNSETISYLNESDSVGERLCQPDVAEGKPWSVAGGKNSSECHNIPQDRFSVSGSRRNTNGAELLAECKNVSFSKIYRKEAIGYETISNKIRMMLELPDSSEILMKSFKAKLRSQIRRPMKEGFKTRIGSKDLLDDFYRVFSTNMRDLGSPVHRKELMGGVLSEFANDAKIVMVYRQREPVACSVVIGFAETLGNPWASSLRRFSRLSPNMLLYWRMLEYACDNGFKYFDFGRSSPDEGTYKFKEQWGSLPVRLQWQRIPLKRKREDHSIYEDRSFQMVSEIWKQLPISLSRIIGPRIRKHIGL
jgi:serine/alanine adding enzyme